MKRIIALLLVFLLAGLPLAGYADVLSRGSKGDSVKQLQEKLNSLGYRVGTPDGDFGGKTESALKDFQGDNALEATGTLTANTEEWLYSDGSGSIPAPRGAFAIRADAFEADPTIHRYSYVLADFGWEQANTRAIEMGGHLVSIDSFGEYSELLSEIHELGAHDVNFWIGVRRKSMSDFYMVDADGVLYIDPIDFDTLLGGYRPWALGCPTYKDEAGNQENYVRMRFSEGEQRWVWEDCVGAPEAGARNGFIVEYDDPSVLAALAEADVDGAPALSLLTEPIFMEAVPASYSIDVLGLEGRSALARVTTVKDCSVEFYFTDLDGKEIFWVSERIRGGLNNRLIRVVLSEENYNSLPRNFNIEGILFTNDSETGKSTDYTDWVMCSLYRSGDNGRTPVRPRRHSTAVTTAPEVYRVTITTALDPNGTDPNAIIEIYDADGNLVATVHPGETIYLKPGDYIIKDPNDPNADTPFSVTDAPVVAELRNAPLYTVAGVAVDAETGAALAGATVELEAQGYARTTTADASGAYRFENVRGVDARITILSEGEQVFLTNHTDIHVGSQSQDVKAAAQPKVSSVIYGYVHDGGVNRPSHPENGSYLYRDMYITVADDPPSAYPGGTIFDVQGDIIQSPSHEECVMSFFTKYGLDPSCIETTLLKITGNIRPDNLEEMYPGYDAYFTGWSDMLLEVENVEPAE